MAASCSPAFTVRTLGAARGYQVRPISCPAGPGPSALLVTRTDRFRPLPIERSIPAHTVVRDPAIRRELYRIVCSLEKLYNRAFESCTADSFVEYHRAFSSGHRRLLRVTVDATGCGHL